MIELTVERCDAIRLIFRQTHGRELEMESVLFHGLRCFWIGPYLLARSFARMPACQPASQPASPVGRPSARSLRRFPLIAHTCSSHGPATASIASPRFPPSAALLRHLKLPTFVQNPILTMHVVERTYNISSFDGLNYNKANVERRAIACSAIHFSRSSALARDFPYRSCESLIQLDCP